MRRRKPTLADRWNALPENAVIAGGMAGGLAVMEVLRRLTERRINRLIAEHEDVANPELGDLEDYVRQSGTALTSEQAATLLAQYTYFIAEFDKEHPEGWQLQDAINGFFTVRDRDQWPRVNLKR